MIETITKRVDLSAQPTIESIQKKGEIPKSWYADFVTQNALWIRENPQIQNYIRGLNLQQLQSWIEENLLDKQNHDGIKQFLEKQINPNKDTISKKVDQEAQIELTKSLEKIDSLSQDYYRLLTPTEKIDSERLNPDNEIDAILLEKYKLSQQNQKYSELIKLEENISHLNYKIDSANLSIENLRQEIGLNLLSKHTLELTQQLQKYLSLFNLSQIRQVDYLEKTRMVLSELIINLNEFNSNHDLKLVTDCFPIVYSIENFNPGLFSSLNQALESLVRTAKLKQENQTNLEIIVESDEFISKLNSYVENYQAQKQAQIPLIQDLEGQVDTNIVNENNRVYLALENQIRNEFIGNVQQVLERHPIIYFGLNYTELENYAQGFTDTIAASMQCIQKLTESQREIASRTQLQKAMLAINSYLRTNKNLDFDTIQKIFVSALEDID